MSEPPVKSSPDAAAAPPHRSLMQKVDAWMAEHPFHPRVIPFVVWVLLLMAGEFVRGWWPAGYVGVYAFQIVLVTWLLWRYRRLMPEMTLSWHWLALPIGLAGAVAWMGLAFGMEALSPVFESRGESYWDDMGPAAAWMSMIARFVGMVAVVPVFEELFFRSALLRALHRPTEAKAAAIQFIDDLPVVGEWCMRTKASKWADGFARPLADAFARTPVGAVSVFAVVMNLVLWCLISHTYAWGRDYLGTIACGLLFIWLVWYTNRGERKLGLGPVIWAHGITNAVLWIYTVGWDDWRFM